MRGCITREDESHIRAGAPSKCWFGVRREREREKVEGELGINGVLSSWLASLRYGWNGRGFPLSLSLAPSFFFLSIAYIYTRARGPLKGPPNERHNN